MKVVWVLANNSSAPYFSWFAERSLQDKSIDLSFVALYPTRPDMVAEMKARGLNAHWVKFDHLKRSTSVLSAIPALVRLFRRIKPDVVHAHLFDDALPSLIAARLAGVRIRVITKGDTAFHWFYAKKGVKYDRLNNRNATHIIALSNESRAFIIGKENAAPGKISLIHHGIPPVSATKQDEAVKAKLKEKFGIKPGDIVISTVARLIAWKGHRQIIEAAALLTKTHKNLKFLFAGNGPELEHLQQLIRKENLGDHISFTGWIAAEDMPSFYGIADIYLHAAVYEPFGFVIAEAMMNGVPVVSTPTGAAADAITSGVNGILANGHTAAAIAEALAQALAADRSSMGVNGKNTALEIFPFEKMFTAHMALYEEALRKTGKGEK